ncbi:MAG: hypothetical protein R8M14_04575 [Ghiorsea sp.]
MRNFIKIIFITSFILVGCGGTNSTSGTSSATGGVNGTVTFSGSGAVDVLSGTSFTPGFGTLTSGAHPVLPATTFYSIIWLITGSGSSDGTSITYTENTSATATSYSIAVSSGQHTPVFSFNNWNGFDAAAQTIGITVDKTAKSITFTDVTINGTSGTTTTLILNGTLTAQ